MEMVNHISQTWGYQQSTPLESTKDHDGSSPCAVIDPMGTNFNRVIGQWAENGIGATDGEKLRRKEIIAQLAIQREVPSGMIAQHLDNRMPATLRTHYA